MKTNATIQTERRAQEQSEQSFKAPEGEFNKYIVLTWQGREQVTVFPFAVTDFFLSVLSAKLVSRRFWQADRTAMVNVDRMATLWSYG
jgi:hypothetical protein